MNDKTANSRIPAKKLALVCVFAPLCTVFSFWSLFPIIGAVGLSIKVTAIIAPMIGIILGPYFGALAVALGGFIGISLAQAGPFGPFSFVPWMATAFCSGLVYNHRWRLTAVLYSALLLIFAFYPAVGPAWLYPYFIWFQLVGLAILISPLQSRAILLSQQTSTRELILGVGVTALISVLFGHIAGSMMFEAMYWPALIPEVSEWIPLWQTLTLIYPIERMIITIIVAIIGVPIIKALKAEGYKMGGT